MKFNPEMLEAVLDQFKTQTRRPIQHNPHPSAPYWDVTGMAVRAPHGKYGDEIPVEDHNGVDTGRKIKITGVRIERLRDITEEDAIEEGVSCLEDHATSDQPHVDSFKKMWASIYGAWNPSQLVWVYDFILVWQAQPTELSATSPEDKP